MTYPRCDWKQLHSLQFAIYIVTTATMLSRGHSIYCTFFINRKSNTVLCLAGCDIICRNTLTNKAFNNLTILVEWWFWIHKLSNYSILLLLDKWWREGLKWGDSLNQRLARVNSDHVSILECSDLGYEFH